MPKRKRTDDSDQRYKRPRTYTVPSSKNVEQEITNGMKQLTKALKLAQGFERQKLGRRLKNATKSDDEAQVSRINAEIGALKARRWYTPWYGV